ncbi:MAG: redox-regulated ATPase YchF [Gammaproteobacteria bacterium]|uniref:Ribosome-binding ATPase YchF n=1 Tax=SAR86 cluster bacterium TaxID=2030880 RepID=A0A368BRP5_9GAMM|nr:MAG: redox-regulated ATPase YchF [SAR86 cluster bacterium]
MGFKCGILGLPNVGKSTLFNAITKSSIPAENFPFCTIEPNLGIVNVPDKRLDSINDIVNSEKVIPTSMSFVDIAGLVKGASQGEGLGNAFLSNIREMNALLHVVRCFDDENVVHVDGAINPLKDVETINLELIFSDLEVLEKRDQKLEKLIRSGDKEATKQKDIIQTLKGLMESGNLPRLDNFQPEEIKFIESMNLLSTKPMVLVANLSDDESKNNIDDLNNYAKSNCIDIIPAVIKVEHELAALEEEEQAEYLELLGMDEPVLNKIILAGYKLLGLETFFTSGPKESRAWTVYKNSLAPQAAGVIHTDFERGFIKAEVISYEDFISSNGESGAKKDGKLRLEGKDYLVKDGDVIHFKFNV